MTTEKLFEMATRSKLRFPSTKGELSVEDLWDLSDKDLDVVYKNLKDQEVKSSEESLLDDANVDPKLTAAIGIVKYIFTTKRNERLAEKELKMQKRFPLCRISVPRPPNAGQTSLRSVFARFY